MKLYGLVATVGFFLVMTSNLLIGPRAADAAPPVRNTLTVNKSGSGQVQSSPNGINCGSRCAARYQPGTVVTLTATPASGWAFMGWNGGGCSGTDTCTVTMNADISVTATFASQSGGPFTLTVSRGGTGTGTVTSNPVGISCGSDCTEAYPSGTPVTLTAAPDNGSAFAGWSGGGCSGTGSCTVTMNANTSVTATFTIQSNGPFTLTVSRSGTGTGTVTSSPAGINCGTDCSEAYPSGTAVTLTAAPDNGSVFGGWGGGGCSGTATCTVTMTANTLVTATFALAGANPIVTENQQPGSSAWQLGSRQADDRTKQIKGYASATSVVAGDSLTFYVTVNPAQNYTIDIYRIGWYAGLGGRQVLHAGPLSGTTQAACPPNATTGLISCAWSAGYTLAVPATWTTGIYLGVLTNAGGYQNYVMFVVRDDTRTGALLYQQSVTTYQAYNNYPDDGQTGKSLYTFNSYGANTIAGDQRAVKVSYDRPYSNNSGAGQLFDFEINFVRWLEHQGYDLTYTTDIDTHANGNRLLSAAAFLVVGHDEYWSDAMFDSIVAARDAGVDLGFFSSDVAYWQIRFEPSASGAPNRIQVCYKDASIDPVSGPTTTVAWQDPLLNRPAQLVVGLQSDGYVTWGQNVSYVVQNSGHWVYAGTGLRDGDAIPGIVGYEMDRYLSQYPLPASLSRTTLSHSPYTDLTTRKANYAESAIYQATSGGWVFAAGTNSWSWGLDNFYRNRADARIQQITTNILNVFLFGGP